MITERLTWNDKSKLVPTGLDETKGEYLYFLKNRITIWVDISRLN